jgi:hypothetical protein
MKNTFLKAAAVVALTAATASAASAQLVGTLNLVGGQVFVTSSTTANAPVNIDFVQNGNNPARSFGTPNGPITVTSGTGIFTGLAGQTSVMTDLQINGAGTQIMTVGAPQLFTIGGFTFTVNMTAQQAPAGAGDIPFGPIVIRNGAPGTIAQSTAELFLSGTVTGNGLMNAAFSGSLTAQFPGLTAQEVFNRANGIGGTLDATSFSASFAVTNAVIPEPSTYALLATGIAGLGVFARRRRQQA